MPQYLNNTLTPTAPQAPTVPTGYVDQNEAKRAELLARMQQEAPPMFTPEEAAARVARNKRQYQMGMLAAMSGDEALSPVGGMVLKNALANRQQHVTERGTADPLTGKFTPSPEYVRAQQQAQVDRLDAGSATSRERYDREIREDKRDAETRRQSAEYARERAAGNEPLVQILGDDGSVTYVRRSDAVGKKAAPKGGGAGSTTEGERKASGFAGMMLFNNQTLDRFEPVGGKTTAGQILGFVPLIGDSATRRAMTPEQQQYDAAARMWIRAKLRQDSGATIPDDEMDGEIKTFFPQPEDGPETRLLKQKARELATRSMVAAAGRSKVVESENMYGDKPAPGQATPKAAPSGTLSAEDAAELAALRARFPKAGPK